MIDLLPYNNDSINADIDLKNVKPGNEFRKNFFLATLPNWSTTITVIDGESTSLSYTAPSNGYYLPNYIYKATSNVAREYKVSGNLWFIYGNGGSSYADGGFWRNVAKNQVVTFSGGLRGGSTEYFVPTYGLT